MQDEDHYARSESNDDYSTSAPVITTGGGSGLNATPKTLLDAISLIQQCYVIESKSKEIPGEFLTINGSITYFKVGASSGFSEGMFVFLLFPVFHFYLAPFIFKTDSFSLKIIFLSIPFMSILINGGICVYVSKFYIGNLTRKAINALLSGRSLVLMMKSLFVYVVYTFISGLSTPDRIWEISKHFKKFGDSFYTHYMEILPHMMPMATKCAICILAAGIIPFGTVFLFDVMRTSRIKRNRKRIFGK